MGWELDVGGLTLRADNFVLMERLQGVRISSTLALSVTLVAHAVVSTRLASLASLDVVGPETVGRRSLADILETFAGEAKVGHR